jgi:hypothetical protein
MAVGTDGGYNMAAAAGQEAKQEQAKTVRQVLADHRERLSVQLTRFDEVTQKLPDSILDMQSADIGQLFRYL